MKAIRDLLTGRPPMTLTAEATAMEAAQAMERAKVGCVLVVDSENAPVGIFTERDLMVRVIVAGLDPKEVRLERVMTSKLFTVTPERRINEVAREVQSRHIRHLPVVEGSTVLGMLSLRDLLREHLDVKRKEVQALTAYIQGDPEPPA